MIYFLRASSIGYLLLPNLVFFLYWTNSYISGIGIAILLFLFFRVLKDKNFSKTNTLNGKDILILLGAALVITLLSGVTGIFYQTMDYWCHNTKFYELFKYGWPIRLPVDGPIVSYYYGYYVVPALLFKWLGGINEPMIFVWTFLGFFLGISWIYLALNKKIWFAFIALSVGDTSQFSKLVYNKLFGPLYEPQDFGVQVWSNFENLFWVPNQVIPTLIIGGMFFYILKNKLRTEYMVLPVALTFWWAVFPAFTSGLLIGILIIRKWYIERADMNLSMIVQDVLLPFIACLPILLLFLSHEQAPVSGFVWQFGIKHGNRVLEYLNNIGVNVILFILIYFMLKKTGSSVLPAIPFFLMVIFITVLPVYRLGKVNDFLLRGLMPYLIIIGLYLLYPLSLDQTYADSWRRLKGTPVLLLLFLILSSCSIIAASRIYQAATVNIITSRLYPDKVSFQPIPYDAYPNVYEVLKEKWSLNEAHQYLGEKGSFYEENIMPVMEQK